MQCGAGTAFLIIEGTHPRLDRPAIVSPSPAVESQGIETFFMETLRALPALKVGQVSRAGGNAIAMRIVLSEKRSAWLVVDDFVGDLTSGLSLVQGLVEALRRALPLYDIVADAERRRLVAEYVIETSGTGILLVEADGRVMTSNDVANMITAENGPLMIVDGRIRARTSALTRALLDAVADMASKQSQRVEPDCYVPIALADPERSQPLTLIVRPGPPYGPVSAPLKRTAVIVLRDPARRAMLPEGDLEQLFGLSPAEARLATRLANGDDLDGAASGLNIGRNTVRSQLQSIFAKTGVNRQGDLVRLLLSSAVSQVGRSSSRIPN